MVNALTQLDESNLKKGFQTSTGKLTVDFGEDGIGSITPNGAFNLNGLKSAGQEIKVVLQGTQYVATRADGVKVFDLSIASSGHYTFHLYQPVDHANKANPNDSTTIGFGIKATDADGDSASTFLNFNILDDGPVAVNDAVRLTHNTQALKGNVLTNDNVGADANTNPLTKVTYKGVDYVITPGVEKTIVATLGTLKIKSDGSYSYVAKGTGSGVDTFTYTITDKDGDTSKANFGFDVEVCPVAANDIYNVPTLVTQHYSAKVGDTVLVKKPGVTMGGQYDYKPQFTLDHGATVAGTQGNIYEFRLPVLSNDYSPQGLPLSITGVTIVSASARGGLVRPASVRISDDHKSIIFYPGHDTDLVGETYKLQYTISDGKSCTKIATVIVNVSDHTSPLVLDLDRDGVELSTVQNGVLFDMTNDGIKDKTSWVKSDDGLLAIDKNNDGIINNKSELFGDTNQFNNGFANLSSYDSNKDGKITSKDAIWSKLIVWRDLDQDGVSDKGEMFSLDKLGITSINLNAKATDYQIQDSWISDESTFTYANGTTGKIVDAWFSVQNSISVQSKTATLNGSPSVDESALTQGAQTFSGKLTVDFGEDGFGSITPNGQFTPTNLKSSGLNVTVTLQGNQYVGMRSDGVKVFEITISNDGAYKFDLFKPLDHADKTDPNDVLNINFGVIAKDADGDSAQTSITISVLDDGPVAANDAVNVDSTVSGNVLTNDKIGVDANSNPVTKITFGGKDFAVNAGAVTAVAGNFGTLKINANGTYTYTSNNKGEGTDTFVYTITDKDGDTARATLAAKVLDKDDQPVIVQPDVKTVDETNLNPNTSVTGKVVADFKDDGPGKYEVTGVTALNGLTSGGQPITITTIPSNGITSGYVGKVGTKVIFTLTINQAKGDYIFNLLQPVDHSDKANPNDVKSINLGVKATDADGDIATTSIRINILDDGPVAVNDSITLTEKTVAASGNVLTNDKVGADANANAVTKVTFAGKDYAVVAGVLTTVNGTYGILKINANGTYTYFTNGKGPGTDGFSYTITDKDGDKATATLKAVVTDVDTKPTMIQPAVQTVDETNLKPSTVVNGKVVVDYGADAPGAIAPNGVVNLNGLKSQGQPIVVTQTADGYKGTSHGATIFTLTINPKSGDYTFILLSAVDHPVKTNANDAVSISFGVKATDKDGDAAATTIRINILDDGPVAVDDGIKLAKDTKSLIGNVFSNDKIGADYTTNPVTKVTYKGVDYAIAAGSSRTIVGDFGKLIIDSHGAYNYTANGSKAGIEKFTYTIADKDGDTDTATFSFDVKALPPVVDVKVNNNVDDVVVKEDGSVFVKVGAQVTNIGTGDVMTLTLSGVKSGWGFSGSGWTSIGGGQYKLTLPAGTAKYDGGFTFKPPAQSDVDMTGLKVTANVHDASSGANIKDEDGFNVVVDAVADAAQLSVPRNISAGSWDRDEESHRVVGLPISAKQITDLDGSQVITKIVIKLNNPFEVYRRNDGGAIFGNRTPDEAGFYLNKGVEVKPGEWHIAVNSNNADAALSGLQVIIPNNSWWSGLAYHTWESARITVEAHVQEVRLSGKEVNYSDNVKITSADTHLSFYITPLVIDMDRDGIELTSANDGVFFDMTNDGVKEKTGWVKGDDALLAIDKNHDGIINNQSELFGDDATHANGFENLASYDSNHDGIISAADDAWLDLIVWSDLNQDGISDAGEMMSLAQAGIVSIGLNSTQVEYQIEGNWISDESTVTFNDGTQGKIVDAWFEQGGSAPVIDSDSDVQEAINAFVANDNGASAVPANTNVAQTAAIVETGILDDKTDKTFII